jgi:acyl-CoA-binding protein
VTSFAATVRDVVDSSDGERPEVVRLWARTAWDAWAAHHAHVRLWLSVAVGSMK